MSGSQAKVQSIPELDAFRASLLVYLEKADRILDDVRHQVVNTRTWLQTDRQLHWKNEVRRRTRALEQAEQELLTARLGGHEGAIQDRRMAVQRARRTVDEAQERQARVRRWLHRYEADVESKLRPVLRLRQVVGYDLQAGVRFLEGAASTLAEYAGMLEKPPGADATSGQPGSGGTSDATRTMERTHEQVVPRSADSGEGKSG
jgi:hypothetical protein